MGLAKSQKSLKKWTAQKWRTSSGKKSEGKRRYLPDAAWRSLSSEEKAEGNKKGKQFVKQPRRIANKVKRFR
jgi:hypothetical protein